MDNTDWAGRYHVKRYRVFSEGRRTGTNEIEHELVVKKIGAAAYKGVSPYGVFIALAFYDKVVNDHFLSFTQLNDGKEGEISAVKFDGCRVIKYNGIGKDFGGYAADDCQAAVGFIRGKRQSCNPCSPCNPCDSY